MTVTSTMRARLLASAWVVGIGAYTALLVQKIGFETASIANISLLAVGTIIALRKPDNVIGPILVTVGAGLMAVISADVTAETLAEAGRIEAAGWVALIARASSILLLWLINVALWLLFPDGRTQSIGTQRFLEFSGAYAVILTLVTVFSTPQVLGLGAPTQPHPFLDASVAESVNTLTTASTGLLFLSGWVAAGMLIARARRSGPVERRQIMWVALAVILTIALQLLNAFVHPLGSAEDRAFVVLDGATGLLLAGAFGVAILRYRLYEIDRIVSRSVTFGGLAVFIGGVYIAIVVGVGRLLGGDAGFGLSVVASVLVALSFQPARRWVQRWANRLVYGNRATPHEVLVQFSHRSSELSDEELLERIPQLMVDGTGARSAALWTRTSDGFATVATWPVESGARTLADGPAFADPEADFSLPVFNDGELLGGLSLRKDEGEATTPAEEALLADLASGMGLALRNAQLTGALRRQVAELETSRERVLVAADAARRELENTLDSGPQQQLVALKVKLGPTRKRAEQLGAVKTAGLLSQLEQQAGDAIKAVREFAGGIYPPLLEAEGLVTAIAQQARSAAMPVSVNGEKVRRYPREVEAAVYFSVLEAIQNSTKYAEASSVAVSIVGTGQELSFDVVDDGRGFDTATVTRGAGLHGIADRLDTVGGTVTIASTPGTGTTITGTIPLLASIEVQPPSVLDAAQHSSRASMPNSDFGRNPMAPAASAGSS